LQGNRPTILVEVVVVEGEGEDEGEDKLAPVGDEIGHEDGGEEEEEDEDEDKLAPAGGEVGDEEEEDEDKDKLAPAGGKPQTVHSVASGGFKFEHAGQGEKEDEGEAKPQTRHAIAPRGFDIEHCGHLSRRHIASSSFFSSLLMRSTIFVSPRSST
jgi:hypothetical protein